jgi:endonuclease III
VEDGQDWGGSMKESGIKKRERAGEIVRRLRQKYPGVGSALDYEDPLQCMVATILSAQCTDARVNLVTPALFQKYPTVQDYLNVPQQELENDIRSTGFFRNKAKSIQASCRAIVETYSGSVPRTMDELLTMEGIGRKTANCILCNAYGQPGIMVDTHVKRLAFRMGLTHQKNPDKIEFDLKAMLPESDWTDASHLLIHHGRNVCMARKPKCSDCILGDICPRMEVSAGQ